jgi:hypothetical protein
LIQRGDTTVVRKLAQNQGATFSDGGYVTLAERAETDERLAENLGMRLDMPPQLLQDLTLKATETVRARLLIAVPAERQAAIQGVLSQASDKVLRKAAAPRDFSRAVALIDKMQSDGRLNEKAIVGFAEAGRYEGLVAGLARVCATPIELIERLMQNVRYDGILVACKAAELSSADLQCDPEGAVRSLRGSHHRHRAGTNRFSQTLGRNRATHGAFLARSRRGEGRRLTSVLAHRATLG